jgi:hypothetical protein
MRTRAKKQEKTIEKLRLKALTVDNFGKRNPHSALRLTPGEKGRLRRVIGACVGFLARFRGAKDCEPAALAA